MRNSHLALDVSIFEDQREGCDVFFAHSLAAAHLDGLLDSFVDFSWVGTVSCNVIGQLHQRAIGESG